MTILQHQRSSNFQSYVKTGLGLSKVSKKIKFVKEKENIETSWNPRRYIEKDYLLSPQKTEQKPPIT